MFVFLCSSIQLSENVYSWHANKINTIVHCILNASVLRLGKPKENTQVLIEMLRIEYVCWNFIDFEFDPRSKSILRCC